VTPNLPLGSDNPALGPLCCIVGISDIYHMLSPNGVLQCMRAVVDALHRVASVLIGLNLTPMPVRPALLDQKIRLGLVEEDPPAHSLKMLWVVKKVLQRLQSPRQVVTPSMVFLN
jgi:hypothetical protein